MKYNRHRKILEIIENNIIETQDDLAEHLRTFGFDATQATVSRDIKELKIIKVLTNDGKYKYAVSKIGVDLNLISKLDNIFSESVIKVDSALNSVVIKTIPGMAQGAASLLDNSDFSEILGTIAGDDTILVITRSEMAAIQIVKKFNDMLK